MQNVHFTPPKLAKIFNVNVSTIKRWIDKKYLPSFVTAGGHRRVSKQQLAEFTKKYPMYAKNSYRLNRLLAKGKLHKEQWKTYYTSLYNYQNTQANQFIRDLYFAHTPLLEILSNFITPALEHIGIKWQKKIITVYDEHRMTFIIRTHLLELHSFIPEPKKNAPHAVLACVPNEHHEIPLQMLALLLKSLNWNITVLGINVPSREIKQAASTLHPKLICLSQVYTKNYSSKYLKQVEQITTAHKTDLAIGGRGWPKKVRKHPSFYPSLGEFETYIKNSH